MKIELFIVAIFALFAVIAVPSVSAQTYPANSVYFEPEDSHAKFCENTYVQIMVTANVDTTGAGMDIYFDPNCVNITNVDFTGTPYSMLAWWEHWGNYVRIGVMGPMAPIEPGTHLIANLTLHCVNEADCTSDLAFSETELLDGNGNPLLDVTWHDGTFTCESHGKPDLEIEDKWEEWVNETHYSVSYTIHNKGTAIAPACHNTMLYVDDVAIEHKHVPVALAYCEKYTDTFDTTIECTGYSDIIRVCADNYEVIDELDETNNCMTNEFRCVGPPPGPDLVITDIWENDGTIWFKIENRGTEEAGSSYTALYVNGAYQACKKVGSLDSRKSTELYFRYVYTPGTDDIVEVCADRGNDVAESNEANNCRTVIWECDRRS